MINSAQINYVLNQSLAYEIEKARVDRLEHALASLQTAAEAESAKVDEIAAAKPRDIVAQGLKSPLSESDSPDNPISRLATTRYVDSRIAFLIAEVSQQRENSRLRNRIARWFRSSLFGRR